MKIDALLNLGEGDSYTDPPRSQHASIPPSTHDTSPGPLSSATATTHSSNSSTNHSFNPHSQHHQHHQVFVSCHSANSNSSSTHPSTASAPSSPDHYHPRERLSSVSSSSTTNGGDRRRPPRPKYEEEEMYFIWYHRVDLCQEWKEVRHAFNRQFPDRQRCGFQGIQCKFYRFLKEKKCPTLREQRRMRDGDFLKEGASAALAGEHGAAPKFGVREYTDFCYSWMRKGDGDVVLQSMG